MKCVHRKYYQLAYVISLNGTYSYLNAMKASPSSPPTMCTPPSGMERPRKKFLMSRAFADHGRFCSLMMTLIVVLHGAWTYKDENSLSIFDLHKCSNLAYYLGIWNMPSPDNTPSWWHQSQMTKCYGCMVLYCLMIM